MVRSTALALVALLLSAVVVVVTMGPAAACSCSVVDHSLLDRSDGAFAGTVLEVGSGGGPSGAEGDWYVATIEVVTDLKDNLDDTIHVRSHQDDGGNCGTTLRVGELVAAVVQRRDGGELDTDACLRTTPDQIAAWTAPVGEGGRAAAFATTNTGPYRLVAHDLAGQRVAFGTEPGNTRLVGLCDGDTALVEVVSDPSGTNPRAEIRDLASFEIMDRQALRHDERDLLVEQVTCGLDPLSLGIWASIDGRSPATGFALDDGRLLAVEFAERPTTRSVEYLDLWPSITTPRGVTFDATDSLRAVYELPAVVDVGPTGAALVVEPLGAGLPAPDSSGSRTATIALIVGIAFVGAGIAVGVRQGRKPTNR